MHCASSFSSHRPPDLRKLYFKAGAENKPTVFLFTDTQVVVESFLEDINNILSSGEVPNLYSKAEDFEEVQQGWDSSGQAQHTPLLADALAHTSPGRHASTHLSWQTCQHTPLLADMPAHSSPGRRASRRW